MPYPGQPVLVLMRITHSLVPLHAEHAGQEDAGGQGHVAHTLTSMEEACRVGQVMQHHGAHGQVGEEEHQVRQAQGQQQVVEH